MINEKYSIAMAEVLHYLKGIKDEDINRIPNKFIKFIEENAKKDYKCEFDYTKPLKDLNLKFETRGLISMICLNYWCENEEQKERFKSHLSKNELKYQEELRKKYNPEDVFKNKQNNFNTQISEKQEKRLDLVEYKEQKWYQKLFKKILKVFGKN